MDNQLEEQTVEYASFGIRILARVLDEVVYSLISVLIFFNIMEFKSIEILLLLAFIRHLYKPLMEYQFGSTFGKMICKIKVVDESYQKISFNQTMIRWVHHFPFAILATLGYIEILDRLKDINFESFIEFNKWLLEYAAPSELLQYAQMLVFTFAMFVAFDSQTRRGMHDRLAKTFVIKVAGK